MVKQAVKVLVRSRPTANFASKNIKIDPLTGVKTFIEILMKLLNHSFIDYIIEY